MHRPSARRYLTCLKETTPAAATAPQPIAPPQSPGRADRRPTISGDSMLKDCAACEPVASENFPRRGEISGALGELPARPGKFLRDGIILRVIGKFPERSQNSRRGRKTSHAVGKYRAPSANIRRNRKRSGTTGEHPTQRGNLRRVFPLPPESRNRANDQIVAQPGPAPIHSATRAATRSPAT